MSLIFLEAPLINQLIKNHNKVLIKVKSKLNLKSQQKLVQEKKAKRKKKKFQDTYKYGQMNKSKKWN